MVAILQLEEIVAMKYCSILTSRLCIFITYKIAPKPAKSLPWTKNEQTASKDSMKSKHFNLALKLMQASAMFWVKHYSEICCSN